jgi:DNA-binding FadR family transcriptional regulator
MREAIDRLRRLGADPRADPAALLDADLAFHRAVYRASGNVLIGSLADFVRTAVSPWIGRSLARHGGLSTPLGARRAPRAPCRTQHPRSTPIHH